MVFQDFHQLVLSRLINEPVTKQLLLGMTPRALVTAFYPFFLKFLWYFSKETSSVTAALLQIQAPHFRAVQDAAMPVSSQVLRAVQVSKARAPTSDIYKPGTRLTVGWKLKYVKKRSLVQKDAIKWKL